MLRASLSGTSGYLYSALLQMVEKLLKERTLHCMRKKRHTRKMASVLEAIRRLNYMLWWLVSIFVIDVYLKVY